MFFPALVQAEDSGRSLRSYYDFLFSGEYRRAIDCAAAETARDSGCALAGDLFRIAEAVRYAETAPWAKDAYTRFISERKDQAAQPVLDLARVLLLSQYVRINNPAEAEKILKAEGVSQELRVAGPFRIGGEDALKRLGESASAGFRFSEVYEIHSDEEGVFRFDSLCDDIRNSAFAAETFLSLEQDADVRLGVGSSGFLDIFVDGTPVYSERRQKRFFPLQKTITLHLSRGGHRISAVTAASDVNELSLSLRFGSCSPLLAEIPVNGSLSSFTEEPSLTDGEGTAFDKGYYLSHLGYDARENAGKFFDRVRESDGYTFALSNYYQGSASAKPERKDSFLRKAAEGGVAGAFPALARLSFDQGRFVSGSDFTDRYAAACPHSAELAELKIIRSINALWYEDALAGCGLLARMGFTSAAESLSAAANGRAGNSYSEYENIKKAYFADRNNPDTAAQLAEAASSASETIAIETAAADHPWNINLSVSLAEKVFALRGPKEALPLASAALRHSPYNSRALFLTGEIYHAAGNDLLSKSYMSRAVDISADREDFRRRYETLFGQGRDQYADNIEAWDAASEKYSHEPAVCVLNSSDTVLYGDGSSVTSVREVYRVFSREKARMLAERAVAVNRNTDELVELTYRSISNGVGAQSDDIRTSDLSDPDSRIYIDMTEYAIKAPFVRPGGYLIFEYVLRSTAGRTLKGYYGDEKFFDPSLRILDSRIAVTGFRPVMVKGYRFVPAILRERLNDGRVRTSIRIGELAAVRDETGMLPYADRAPMLVMTTFTDWKEFHDWFFSQMVNRETLTAAMKQKIDVLCAGSSGDEETVSRIYRYVTDRTRYVGDEAGLGGYIPRPAHETWESRAGDCKDIALLLSVLLRAKGIPADIALLRTADSGTADMSFPSLNSFNHSICRVGLPKPLYLDGTVKKYGIFDLPLPDRDVEALVLGEKKSYTERIDSSRYSVPEEISETMLTLSPEMNASCIRTVIRRGVLSVTDDEQQKDGTFLSKYWTKLYPGAEVKDLSRTGGNGFPLMTRYTVELPGFSQKADGALFIPAAIVPFSLYDSFGRSISRENDLYVADYRESVSRVTCRFPAGYELTTLPGNADVSFGGIRLSYSFQPEGKTGYTVISRLSVKRCVLKKNEYQALKEFLSRSALIEGAYVCAAEGGIK
jgi:hypothetical protein